MSGVSPDSEMRVTSLFSPAKGEIHIAMGAQRSGLPLQYLPTQACQGAIHIAMDVERSGIHRSNHPATPEPFTGEINVFTPSYPSPITSYLTASQTVLYTVAHSLFPILRLVAPYPSSSIAIRLHLCLSLNQAFIKP